MRRLGPVVAAACACALLGAAAADARVSRLQSLETETVELSRGSGVAILSGRGALLGHLDKGSIRITDLPTGADTTIRVAGEDSERDIDERTTEYRGTDLTFRVVAGSWRVRINGDGVEVSAVMKGYLGLRGDGRFAIDGEQPRRWPETFAVFRIGG